MGRTVAVSFEDEIVRVVYARGKGKDSIIENALTLRDDEFDDFLSKEKAKSFIVVNDFKDFFQDILSLPVTKKNIIKKLVREEVKKRADFKDFSFIYFILGERLVENTRMSEVFVFAVKNDEIKAITDRFLQQGKTVSAMYPAIFSLASQIEFNEPVLCVSGSGLNKTLFLVKDRVMSFVRSVQSFEKGLSDLDIQNINMTVNYCGQTLRVNPSNVLLFGSLCSFYEAPSYSPVAVACFPCKSGIFLDFASPISAFSADKDMNILSEEYRVFYNLKRFLQYTTIVFAILCLSGLGYLGYLLTDIMAGKERLESLRKDITGIESLLSSYESRKALMASYTPFINDLKEVESFPDLHGLMVFISSLKTDHIRLDSVLITRHSNVFSLELKGLVKAENYANTQNYYERFIKSIVDKANNVQKIKLKSHSLELKMKSFIVEMEYR